MKNFQVLKRNADNTLQIEYNTIAELAVTIPTENGVELRGEQLTEFINNLVNSTNNQKAFSDIDGLLSTELGIN